MDRDAEDKLGLPLLALTVEQVRQIDRLIFELCNESDFGELTIVVAKGRPRFVRPAPSIGLVSSS